MIMKKFYLFATVLAALISCSSDDFVGENNNSPDLNPGNGTESAILFNSGAKKVTRADFTGAVAADMLNNNFVFMGTKTVGSATSNVFDHYNANWVENTANTTQSNSNDWEYVGYDPDDNSSLPAGATQSIKYWDYAASQYDFAAYSLGKGDDPDDVDNSDFATASAFDFDNLGSEDDAVYTLSGTVEQLKACYISDLVTHYNNTNLTGNETTLFGKVVNFSFRSLTTKIRLAFYETVPGYSVKEVKFYTSENATLATDGSEDYPTLFTGSGASSLPTQAGTGTGTMSVYFPTVGWGNAPENSSITANTDYNKAHVTFGTTGTSELSSTMTFEDGLADFADSEKMETSDEYLGRASNAATYAGGLENGSGKYYTVLPNEALDDDVDTNLDNLMIRIKYTLVSNDGSNEEITVDNATAVIPKQLANWHPNYAYTYIFKISSLTNGTTGVGPDDNPVMGLTPITLNAVVVDSEDGVQETITTVSEPSITTYMAGKVVTENDEYIETADEHPIYIVVNDGSDNVTLTASNAKLYIATVEDGALQEITEKSVDNALRYGVISGSSVTVTDAAGKDLVVTDVSSSLTLDSKIIAAESPTGDEITLDNASFVPVANTIYVFQYKGNTSGAYGTYTAVAPVKLQSGTTYYTYNGTSYSEWTGAVDNVIVTEEKYYTRSEGGEPYTYTLVAPAKLTVGNIYYTSERGAGKFVATVSEVVDAENKYWTESSAEVDGEYMYKIIKVAP